MEVLGSIPVLVYLAVAALAVAAFIHFVLPKLKGGNVVAVGTADVHAVLDRIAGHLSTIVEKAAAPPPIIVAPAAAAPAPAAVSAPAVAPVAAVDDQSTWVLCPKTGHKLPPPNTGEELLGYYVRVSPFIGGHGLSDAGGLALMQSALHTPNTGDPATFPFIADEYANREAYFTDAEKADAAALLARDQAAANRQLKGAFPVANYLSPETLPDRLYLFRMQQAYREATSRDIYEDVFYGGWIDVRWVINDAGSTHVAEPLDVNAVSAPLKTWVANRMNGG